jgi:hypothetical protein
VPASIASDYSHDVSTELLQWVASVPNGSVLSFAKRGCYEIDKRLRFRDRRDLTFDGNGATFRAETEGGQGRRHFDFVGGGGLVLRDLTVQGADHQATSGFTAYVESRAFQHAFVFEGVDGATLDHVSARGVYGDFVYIGVGEDGSTWSSNIRVTKSDFEGSGRQDISIIAGKNVQIDHNTIEGVGRSMFDLEPNASNEGALGVRIENNRIGAAGNFVLASKGDGGGHIGDVTITGNSATAPTGNIMRVFGGKVVRGPFVVENTRSS